MKILFVLIVVAFWASLGLTEGWKWRSDYGKPDDNKLINKSSYHNWRFLTNLAFILLPIIGSASILTIISANIIGWVLYERIMSYVIYDDAFRQKTEPFIIFGKNIDRWPIMIEWIVIIISVIVLFLKLIRNEL